MKFSILVRDRSSIQRGRWTFGEVIVSRTIIKFSPGISYQRLFLIGSPKLIVEASRHSVRDVCNFLIYLIVRPPTFPLKVCYQLRGNTRWTYFVLPGSPFVPSHKSTRELQVSLMI